MKDYIKDKLQDFQDDEEKEKLRQTRLQAFKETSGIIHHHELGKKAKSMIVKRNVSVIENEPKVAKSFIAGPSQIGNEGAFFLFKTLFVFFFFWGGTIGMWRSIRAMTQGGAKPDNSGQADNMSTHLTVN